MKKILLNILLLMSSCITLFAKKDLFIDQPSNAVQDTTCVIGVTLKLNPLGLIEFNLNELELDSTFAASLTLPVQISSTSNPADSIIVFTCDQLGGNFIDIFISDSLGVKDSCLVNINIPPTADDDCIDGFVYGCAETEFREPIYNFISFLSINSDEFTLQPRDNCFSMGTGFIESLEVHLAKNVNPLNGVTTFDMIKIRQHILGIESLDSPYKMIAADINNSQTITTADIVALRRLILGLTNDFTNNTSWRFIDADYSFPNPSNPWLEALPESIEYNSGNSSSDLNLDFIAIKIGDVNNSADPEQ